MDIKIVSIIVLLIVIGLFFCLLLISKKSRLRAKKEHSFFLQAICFFVLIQGTIAFVFTHYRIYWKGYTATEYENYIKKIPEDKIKPSFEDWKQKEWLIDLIVGLLWAFVAWTAGKAGVSIQKERKAWEELDKFYKIFIFMPLNKDGPKEWIHYRNGTSEYQEIIDDKLKAEQNFIYNKDVPEIKECRDCFEKELECNLDPITPERLKQDMELFCKFFGYYQVYFDRALTAKDQAEAEKQRETTKEEKRDKQQEIIEDKIFIVDSLSKDVEKVEIEERLIKIKKRLEKLIKPPEPERKQTPEEQLREEVRKPIKILQVAEEEAKKYPELKDKIYSIAYQLIESKK